VGNDQSGIKTGRGGMQRFHFAIVVTAVEGLPVSYTGEAAAALHEKTYPNRVQSLPSLWW
jgi:hypothetical protein